MGTSESDPQVLAAYCRETADQFAQRSHLVKEAEGLRRLADWLARQTELPLSPREWPCMRCEATPGDSCDFTAPATAGSESERFHDGRSFSIGIIYPGGDLRTRWRFNDKTGGQCMTTVENGPGQTSRCRCIGCGERGPVRNRSTDAAEDGQDHSFPGWRELPVVPRPPESGSSRAMAAWMEKYGALYPAGWFERGGPIRTHRPSPGKGHVPGRAPGGGFHMTTDEPEIADAELRSGQLALDVTVGRPARGGGQPSSSVTYGRPTSVGQETLFDL